jgi:type IV pilus assembly protein PilM
MLLTDNTTLGLDLGSTGLRIVEVAWPNGRPVIQRWATLDFSAPVLDWRAMDPDETAGRIRAALQKNGIRAHWAAHSMGGEAVAPQYFNFPQLLPEDVAEAVRIEVEAALPFPAEGALISHLLFPEQRLAPGKVRTHGMAIAAEGDFAESRLLAIRQAGLETFYLETDSTACANAYLVSGAANGRVTTNVLSVRDPQATDADTPIEDLFDSQESIAILNIGHRYTNLALLGPGRTLLVRDVPWGGEQLTKAMMSCLDVSEEEAEREKRRHWEKGPGASGQLQNALPEIIEGCAADCISRLRDTIQYWIGEKLAPRLGRIELTGGGSQVHGLKEVMQDAFDVPAEHWVPALDFAGEHAEAIRPDAARLTVAFGLALRQLALRKP